MRAQLSCLHGVSGIPSMLRAAAGVLMRAQLCMSSGRLGGIALGIAALLQLLDIRRVIRWGYLWGAAARGISSLCLALAAFEQSVWTFGSLWGNCV